jgi:hypothetical protein
MKPRDRWFGMLLAASTFLAFLSLGVSYSWAKRELDLHFAIRERHLRDSMGRSSDESEITSVCEDMTIGPASGVSLVVGLIGFSLTAILGISRRPWGETALVLAPACVWVMCLIISFACLSEWYFP